MNTLNVRVSTQPKWHDEATHGRIIMTGRDAAALLQRLTTNDVLALQDAQGLQTVLTTPIGRIIDVLHVVRMGDALWVMTSANQGPTVYSHIKKNIFFNDQVTLTPAARTHQQFAVYGAAASEVIAAHFAVQSAPERFHGYQHRQGLAAGWCSPIVPLHGAGWRVIVPEGQAHSIIDSLVALDSAELDCWQIEAGEPAFGHELSTEYIPLEAGLEHAISFKKGCYVGQEIIARMESRGRRAKQLRRVRLSALVHAPAPITTNDGRDAGVLTRAVMSPDYGAIGLAYLKTAIGDDVPLVCASAHVTRVDDAWQEESHG